MCNRFGGCRGGGGRLTATGRAVSRRAPRGGGGVGGYANIHTANDPHDTLIILHMHKGGKTIFKKILPVNSGSHQSRSDAEVLVGIKIPFLCFSAILEFSTKF